jgi:hypothetical protein
MAQRKNKNNLENQDGEQNVFSGNEEKRSPFKDDQLKSDTDNEETTSDDDVYRSRNLEIEKERD